MVNHYDPAAILAAYEAGLPYSTIRAQTGASFVTINRIARQSGAPRRKPVGRVRKLDYGTVLRLHADGLSLRKIARKLKCSHVAVWKAIRAEAGVVAE